MILRHGRRGRHCEQDAIGIDKTDLLALADEGDGRRRSTIADTDAVGQQAHDRGTLNPGNLFGSCLR